MGVVSSGSGGLSLVSQSGDVRILAGSLSTVHGLFTSTGLNSTAIGATTASTGAFTTLSASGVTTIGNGAASTNGIVILDGATTNNFGAVIRFNRGGTQQWQLGHESGINGGASDAFILYDQVGSAIGLKYTTSTGLAVTGALSSTQSASNTASAIFTSSHASTQSGISISFSGATPNDATQMFLTCGDTTNTKFQMRSNGGLGNYSANDANLSDCRLKENFTRSNDDALGIINQIELVRFNYIGQKRNVLGAIAQQVEEVAPWLVDSAGFGETPEDGVPLKSVYQTDLQFLTIKAVQELAEENKALRARLAALESN